MVIPLGGLPVMGPPTPGMVTKLQYVKWCVLATYACAVGRFIADDPFGALNDLFGGLFGTFLLREDPQLQSCYRCLHESPLGAMSDGGMACLLPYMFMASLNGIFSSVRVYAIVIRFGTLLPCSAKPGCYLPCLLCVSAVAQLIAVFFCWTVYKQMQQQAFSGVYMHPGEANQQGQGRGGGGSPEGGDGVRSGGGDAEAAGGMQTQNPWRTQAPFQPFQGTGHQLGEQRR
mmetsp:Transcript_139646/g.348234  ORF Transcript_139646/g.348234 Transcript_139646/m.348234 type:complete len:230 (-) Transcript_139646:48-737(-)|eukprot:CAMPEP_0115513136 /NCGR_PEP_ID=MMETSP0271-20121206/74907_1 /TAXON_ID=71861 /ORGANISM="Scrippsiella trochoidea, Strain CCMP3099" /LENGTH=229 /DNA_ID=CAMNT_0002943391 /DNA_START=20 /DNA_END=709 /DNA_ORIENTATION=-